jgi:RNA polymerase primary sigma factor
VLKGSSLARRDKIDPLEKFVDIEIKRNSYLRNDEMADLSEGNIEDLTTMLDRQGIDLSWEDGLPSHHATRSESELEAGEDQEFKLTPEVLEKTSDPVRLYLREMGTVPLLTRQGETEIAKRFERGQLQVLQGNVAFSRRNPRIINDRR